MAEDNLFIRMIICTCVMVVSLLMLSAAAIAEPLSVSIIESEEEATIYIRPDNCEFLLNFKFLDESFGEATEKATKVDKRLRTTLAEFKVVPLALEYSGLAISKKEQAKCEINITAKLVLSLAGILNKEDAPKIYAALCDQVKKIAKTVNCIPEGPNLGVNDPTSYEANAVIRATENAYPVAEALAASVDAEITALDKVTIKSVVWETSRAVNNNEIESPKVACTAKVKVAYAFASLKQ